MSYARVSILGATVGGEKWSINPVFDPTGEFPGWTQSIADAATTAIDAITVPPVLLSFLSTSMSITGCRLEVRDDANDSLIGISEHTKTSVLVGTGTPKMPAQAAGVVSLRTDTAGGSGRGRLYWPILAVTLSPSLRIQTPSHTSLGSEMKSYMNLIRTALNTAYSPITFDLAVRSKTTHTTPHVVRLQTGDVPDTQRRRRDNLPESYASTSYP